MGSEQGLSGGWALAGLIVTAILAPLLLHWLNNRSTRKPLARIEQHTQNVGNGFADDVIGKLTRIEKKVEDVAAAAAYEKGRFDQHIAEHAKPPPA